MKKLFSDCDLAYTQPSDGKQIEMSLAEMRDSLSSPDTKWGGKKLLFTTILENRRYFQTLGFALVWENQLGIQTFPRKFEKVGGAAYDFHRIELSGEHGRASYVYIVLDVIISRCEGRNEAVEDYELRAISNPMPNLVPEYGWCNEPNYWFYSSGAATDFNTIPACCD